MYSYIRKNCKFYEFLIFINRFLLGNNYFGKVTIVTIYIAMWGKKGSQILMQSIYISI